MYQGESSDEEKTQGDRGPDDGQQVPGKKLPQSVVSSADSAASSGSTAARAIPSPGAVADGLPPVIDSFGKLLNVGPDLASGGGLTTPSIASLKPAPEKKKAPISSASGAYAKSLTFQKQESASSTSSASSSPAIPLPPPAPPNNNEADLGSSPSETATVLNAQAATLRDQGKLDEALPLYKRALEICETELGPTHPSTATSFDNLAGLYQAMGQYKHALPLYRHALEICQGELGPKHPSTAISLDNLAGLYQAMGQFKEALPLYKRALDIRKTKLGSTHHSTATSLDNLAGLYKAMDQFKDALLLYNQALDIRKTELGPTHLSTASSLDNLAWLYQAMGQFEKALPLYKSALDIRETELGPNHPSTATSLDNLAGLYKAMGKLEDALPLYKRALVIRKTELGQTHPSTATSLDNLAGLYHNFSISAHCDWLLSEAEVALAGPDGTKLINALKGRLLLDQLNEYDDVSLFTVDPETWSARVTDSWRVLFSWEPLDLSALEAEGVPEARLKLFRVKPDAGKGRILRFTRIFPSDFIVVTSGSGKTPAAFLGAIEKVALEHIDSEGRAKLSKLLRTLGSSLGLSEADPSSVVNQESLDFVLNEVGPSKAPGLVDFLTRVREFMFKMAMCAAMDQESQPCRRSRLMLVGEGRAGKSSLLRSLKRQDFVPGLLSTAGVANCEVDVREAGATIQEVSASTDWIDLPDDANRTDLAQKKQAAATIASRSALDIKRGLKKKTLAIVFPKKDKVVPAEVEPAGVKVDLATGKDSRADQSAEPNLPSINEQSAKFEGSKIDEKRQAGIPLDVRDVALSTGDIKLDDDVDSNGLLLSTWDFGGQKVFQTVQHMFLSRLGVYLVVFDMRKLINGCEIEGFGLVTDETVTASLGYILFWLRQIEMLASGAPIFLIGTHADIISSESNHILIEGLLRATLLTSKVSTEFISTNTAGPGFLFFPVDNSISRKDRNDENLDRNVRLLRLLITQAAEKDKVQLEEDKEPVNYTNYEAPTNWLRICDALKKLSRREPAVPYIPRQGEGATLESIAASFGVVGSELDAMLYFFHRLGLVVFYEQEGLNEYVLLDPQWIMNSIVCVIRDYDLHKLARDKALTPNRFERLKRRGRVGSDVLELLWSDRVTGRKSPEFQFLVAFLENMYLAVKLPLKESTATEYLEYLVPSLLITDELSNDTSVTGERGVSVKFKGFLPEGFLPRLVVAMLKPCGESQGYKTCNVECDAADDDCAGIYLKTAPGLVRRKGRLLAAVPVGGVVLELCMKGDDTIWAGLPPECSEADLVIIERKLTVSIKSVKDAFYAKVQHEPVDFSKARLVHDSRSYTSRSVDVADEELTDSESVSSDSSQDEALKKTCINELSQWLLTNKILKLSSEMRRELASFLIYLGYYDIDDIVEMNTESWQQYFCDFRAPPVLNMPEGDHQRFCKTINKLRKQMEVPPVSALVAGGASVLKQGNLDAPSTAPALSLFVAPSSSSISRRLDRREAMLIKLRHLCLVMDTANAAVRHAFRSIYNKKHAPLAWDGRAGKSGKRLYDYELSCQNAKLTLDVVPFKATSRGLPNVDSVYHAVAAKDGGNVRWDDQGNLIVSYHVCVAPQDAPGSHQSTYVTLKPFNAPLVGDGFLYNAVLSKDVGGNCKLDHYGKPIITHYEYAASGSPAPYRPRPSQKFQFKPYGQFMRNILYEDFSTWDVTLLFGLLGEQWKSEMFAQPYGFDGPLNTPSPPEGIDKRIFKLMQSLKDLRNRDAFHLGNSDQIIHNDFELFKKAKEEYEKLFEELHKLTGTSFSEEEQQQFDGIKNGTYGENMSLDELKDKCEVETERWARLDKAIEEQNDYLKAISGGVEEVKALAVATNSKLDEGFADVKTGQRAQAIDLKEHQEQQTAVVIQEIRAHNLGKNCDFPQTENQEYEEKRALTSALWSEYKSCVSTAPKLLRYEDLQAKQMAAMKARDLELVKELKAEIDSLNFIPQSGVNSFTLQSQLVELQTKINARYDEVVCNDGDVPSMGLIISIQNNISALLVDLDKAAKEEVAGAVERKPADSEADAKKRESDPLDAALTAELASEFRKVSETASKYFRHEEIKTKQIAAMKAQNLELAKKLKAEIDSLNFTHQPGINISSLRSRLVQLKMNVDARYHVVCENMSMELILQAQKTIDALLFDSTDGTAKGSGATAGGSLTKSPGFERTSMGSGGGDSRPEPEPISRLSLGVAPTESSVCLSLEERTKAEKRTAKIQRAKRICDMDIQIYGEAWEDLLDKESKSVKQLSDAIIRMQSRMPASKTLQSQLGGDHLTTSPDYLAILKQVHYDARNTFYIEVDAAARSVGCTFERGPDKKDDRIYEKANLAYDDDFSQLTDLFRGSIAVPTIAKMLEVVNALAIAPNINLVRVKNRLSVSYNAKEESAGYRDLQFNVLSNSPVPIIWELQLHIKAMEDIKKGQEGVVDEHGRSGHARYRARRDLLERINKEIRAGKL